MAWLLHLAPEGFAVIKADVEPPLRERNLPLEWFQARGLRYQGTAATTGAEIPEFVWPKKVRLKTDRKALPHITHFSIFRAVSQTVKEIIDAIEPNVHDFRHVEVFCKNGDMYPEPYFALNSRRCFDDIVIWEESDVHSNIYGDFRMFSRPSFLQRVVIDGSKVSSAHWWITKQMVGDGHTVSDELFSQLKQLKLLRGVEPQQFVEKR